MRTKNTFFNMISNLLPSLLIPLLSLVKMKHILANYGQDIYGTSLYMVQAINYLNLFEGGFSFAFIQSLYSPLVEKNKNKIKELYQGAKFVLKIIGLIIFTLGVIICIFIPSLLKSGLEAEYLRTIFALAIIPQVFDYFMSAPSMVMIADQKEYIVNLIRKSIQIIKIIIEIILLNKHVDYLYIAAIEAISIILQSVIIRFVSLNKYQYLKEKANKDLSTINKAKDYFVHRVSSSLIVSADTLLLGNILGTQANTVYGNYNYISYKLEEIMTVVLNAPKSSFGNMFVKDSKKAYGVYKEFFSFTAFVASCIVIPMTIGFNSFITLWQGESYLLTFTDCILFGLILYLILLRQPNNIIRDTNGLFKETKKYALIELMIKLVFTYIGIKYYGITCALIVTAITYIVGDLILNARYIYKKVFKESVVEYYKEYLKKTIILIIIAILNYVVWNKLLVLNIDRMIMWILMMAILTIINGILLFIIYHFLFKEFKEFENRIKSLFVKK